MDVTKREVFKPPGECINTNKEENKKMRENLALSLTAYKKLQEWSKENPDQIPIKNFIEQNEQ